MTNRSGWLLYLALALVVAPGCDPHGCDGADAAIEIGTGTVAFEPIGANNFVFERGLQGGLHVYGSLRGTGIALATSTEFDERPLVSFTLRAVDGSFTGGFEALPSQFEATAEGVELIGKALILTVDDPEVVDGHAVELTAVVEDICGVTARATAMATIRGSS